MYPEIYTLQMAEEHYKDLLREAETERLICQGERQPNFFEQTLLKLGQQMVVWGYRLQLHSSVKK